jgi:hypothetical protein
MVEVDISIIFAGLSIAASIVYYASVLRNANRTRELQLHAQEQALETRQAQMFLQIYNQTAHDPSFIEAINIVNALEIQTFEEFRKAQEDEDVRRSLSRVSMHYEGLGVMVKEGYVSIRLVALTMTGMTRQWWERVYKSWIEEGRVKGNYKRWLSEAEFLYNELMKYIEEHPELAT